MYIPFKVCVRKLAACLAFIALMFGCAAGDDSALTFGAEVTAQQFIAAVNAGSEPSSTDVPSKYWHSVIIASRPERVYLHRNNLVLVKQLRGTSEEGQYILLAHSSYVPIQGDDGFTFGESKSRVWTYVRR